MAGMSAPTSTAPGAIATAAFGLVAMLGLSACENGHRSGSTQAPLPVVTNNLVVLSNATIPPQGMNFRGQDNRWQVHGEMERISYRYTEADPRHILVAPAPNLAFTKLTRDNAWSVSCVQPTPHCLIEAPPGSPAAGLALIDNQVCEMHAGTPAAPSNDTVTITDGRSCVLTDDPAAAQALASLPGYRQALSLRDWMTRITKAGKAK